MRKRRLSSFELDALMVVEVNVPVNHLICFCEGSRLVPVNALCFEAGVVICSLGTAIAVCCAALSHLTRKAADMQSENDLTV